MIKKYDSSLYSKRYRKYSKRYRNKYSEKLKFEHRRDTELLRKKIFLLLGDKCVKCGFNDFRALQIDHINGGGCKDRNSNARYYYGRIVKSIESNEGKYQLLCANCNWIKRHENKEQPYKEKNKVLELDYSACQKN